MMIEVQYSCDKCGIKKAVVPVVQRSPKENVVEFVDRAALQCVADHDSRSPNCSITSFSEMWIPVEENKPVGNLNPKH